MNLVLNIKSSFKTDKFCKVDFLSRPENNRNTMNCLIDASKNFLEDILLRCFKKKTFFPFWWDKSLLTVDVTMLGKC